MPYNLIEEPWLPVTYVGELERREVGLRTALHDAHRIRELADPSPLVTVALHRLLLAILHRVFGPSTAERWRELWEEREFDRSDIDAYLDPDRFDLFHPERPFYQTPGIPEHVATTVAKLGPEFAAGNNPVLFDHSLDDEPPSLSPAEAARRLVALQAFAIGGLVTRLPGEPSAADASHLVKAAVVLVRGSTLFETLMLNLVRLDGRMKAPFDFDPARDRPAWERDETTAFTDRRLDGYLDLLTWQSRRVLLFPEGSPPRVRRAAILGGYQFPADYFLDDKETMVAYRRRATAKAADEPLVPVGFTRGRALWRDTLSLLADVDDGERPQVVRWLTGPHAPRKRVFELAAFGLATDRAKVHLWRRDELPLPVAYLSDRDLVQVLRRGVDLAEDVGRLLRGAVRRMAALALTPDGDADRDRLDNLVNSLGAEGAYWPNLDVPFRRFMRELPDGVADDAGLAARVRWAADIRRAAMESFEFAASAVESAGRGWRAAAQARPAFLGRLRQLLEEFAPSTEEVPV
ncbi:MAG: type I-E CRISPR-associated protein Cse1/CasA [Hyphomicrobiales bacterium]